RLPVLTIQGRCGADHASPARPRLLLPEAVSTAPPIAPALPVAAPIPATIAPAATHGFRRVRVRLTGQVLRAGRGRLRVLQRRTPGEAYLPRRVDLDDL